jgi:hypothetical protein
VGDWTVFLATCAGCAATLAGLLFVASQLHLDVFADQTNRWAALAQSTLTALSAVLGLSLTFLIPRLPLDVRAAVTIVVTLGGLWRTVQIWWPVVRIADAGRWRRFEQSFWLLIVPIAVYVYLMVGGVQLAQGTESDGLITIASAFLGLFAISLGNSWRLVVAVRGKTP